MKKIICLLLIFTLVFSMLNYSLVLADENEKQLKIIDLKADTLIKCGTNIYELKKQYSADDGYIIKLAAYDKDNRLLGTSSDDDYRARFPKQFAKINAFVWRTYSDNGNNITSLSLQVGVDETEKRLVWYNDASANGGKVQYALKSDYENDGGFTDENSKEVEVSVENPYSNTAQISCKAILKDLILGETYIYRIGGKDDYSEKTYEFINQDPNVKNVFNIVSDLHFIAWEYDSVKEAQVLSKVNLMKNTWQTMLNYNPELSFVIGTGDNVSQANMGYSSGSESEFYRTKAEMEMEMFFSNPLMKSVPFASTLGNHEARNVTSDTPNPYASVTKYHYNLPNDDGHSGHHLDCNTSGNFWFRNGDVLIIGITATKYSKGSMLGTSASVNEAYIKKACDSNKDAKWKILINHVPAYAFVAGFDETLEMRKVFADMNLDNYDIDAVFTGHSHAFSRSKQLLTNVEAKTIEVGGKKIFIPKVVSDDKIKITVNEKGYQIAEITNPEGTVHYNIPATTEGGFYSVMPEYKEYTNAFGVSVNGKNQFTYANAKEGNKYDSSEFDGVILYSSPMFTNVEVESTDVGSKMTIKVIQSNAMTNKSSENVTVVDTYIINKTIK